MEVSAAANSPRMTSTLAMRKRRMQQLCYCESSIKEDWAFMVKITVTVDHKNTSEHLKFTKEHVDHPKKKKGWENILWTDEPKDDL